MKAWADSVKSRDGKCGECGKSEDLHAHHIKPKSTYPELSLDPNNGKTLCYRCHKAEHEKNRPVRIRSNRPQRKKLEARISELEAEVARLRTIVKKLRADLPLDQEIGKDQAKALKWKARQEMAVWRRKHKEISESLANG
jgi:translation initiation factor 1 (eIF-1/SUI1)